MAGMEVIFLTDYIEVRLPVIFVDTVPLYPCCRLSNLSQQYARWVCPKRVWAQHMEEAGMTMFMSTISGKIDAKGRVSVPSVFRSTISAQTEQRNRARRKAFSSIPLSPKTPLKATDTR